MLVGVVFLSFALIFFGGELVGQHNVYGFFVTAIGAGWGGIVYAALFRENQRNTPRPPRTPDSPTAPAVCV